MRADFKISAPESVTCEMTVSMTLGEWKKVKQALETWSSHSSFQLRNAIGELITKAEKEISSTGTTQ